MTESTVLKPLNTLLTGSRVGSAMKESDLYLYLLPPLTQGAIDMRIILMLLLLSTNEQWTAYKPWSVGR